MASIKLRLLFPIVMLNLLTTAGSNLFQHLFVRKWIPKPACPAGKQVRNDGPEQGDLTLD